MLSDAGKTAIQQSWRLIRPIADTASGLFYRRLFELEPRYRQLFSTDLTAQKRKLIGMLAFVVGALDWPQAAWRQATRAENDLFLAVLALGRRHARLYSIPAESYEVVGQALLWALDQALGAAFTSETRKAWSELYRLLALTMRMGAEPVDGNIACLHETARRPGSEDKPVGSPDAAGTETT